MCNRFNNTSNSTITCGTISASLQITFISSSSPHTLHVIPLLEEKGRQTGGFGFILPGDPGGLTGSRCSSYETESCLEREALRILAKLCAGGRASWKGPEPFRKGIQDYQCERKSLRRGRKRNGESERNRKRREEVRMRKLFNASRTNKGSQTFTMAKWL